MAMASFSAGLSGLNANAEALGVIGNNLANVNTVGFKASSIAFADLLYQNVGASGANPSQVGLGVGVSQVSSVFTQGNIEATRVATNVALQGNGFFLLDGADGASYTRAGNFALDQTGRLVTADGEFVQGYDAVDPATGDIITTGAPSAITLPMGVLRAPVATSQITTVSNLDSQAAVGTTATTSIQVFDSLGAPHVMMMTYTKTGTGTWDYALTANGAEVSGGTPGTPFSVATGSLSFDGAGTLTAVNGGAPADVSITSPTWANAAPATTIGWNLMDANNTPQITSYAAPSETSSISQNGSSAGTVSNLSIGSDGTIYATVGGQAEKIAQLAIVTFNNPQGLTKLGENRYGDGAAAGLPNIGVAGTGGRGTVIGGALEQSNVDLAHEFTTMILAQRGYQANGKLITVSDQLLVDTLNLKQ